MNETYTTTDLSFITNEGGQTLADRFKTLIKDSKFFDCIVGYFYISGFHLIKEALENIEKIRIIVGLGLSKEVEEILTFTNDGLEKNLSNKQIKDEYFQKLKEEFENSPDDDLIEKGIREFLELVKNRKLEIRVFPSRKLHSKVYILTFREGDRDIGRVITGSSNLSYSGLFDNLEFNVELKNRSDYEFAKQKFEELWQQSVDLTKSITHVIEKETYLNENISPYELYIKFLYEYFIDDLNAEKYLQEKYLPSNYIELGYQTQAVLNAKKIIEAYGGCFISDVVGAGKTYIVARLINELKGRTMIIAPPKLLSKKSPGSWVNVFADFNLSANFFSIGKLDEAIEEATKRNYDNIVIDESHRFRNNSTISYAKIAQICSGKRVILVSATPFNNYPEDLLNQIALFQNKRRSSIPGLPNLDDFFNKLKRRLDQVSRENDYAEYLRVVKENSNEIRNKCLRYIMVRRTRNEIQKYFAKDLEKNKIKFPEVLPPKPLFNKLDKELDNIFIGTIEIITKKLTYARYRPLLYLKEPKKIDQLERQSQINLGSFMKVLLVKRLESSFHAFKKTLERFIESHELFIGAYKEGKVFFSDKYLKKVFELLTDDNFDEIQKLIDEGKVEEYPASDFETQFIKDLENDYKNLQKIKSWWDKINRDPKIEELVKKLKNDPILRNNKIIIFTESTETAEYLYEQICKLVDKRTLLFTGDSSENIREKVIDNFDARAKEPKDDYRILISTEVLSEGVNLHRSNVVINYDIPWNPTRLMQRVGRVNRIDTKFDKIYTFNFFPSIQSENEIELTKVARAKIEAFLNLLGGDSAILTEGEPIASHELFDKLMSVSTLTGEDDGEESELKYLRIIEDIRDNQPELFEKIKRLPKKIRSSRNYKNVINKNISNGENILDKNSLLTFFRRGKLNKFFYSTKNGTYELDFLTAAKIFECQMSEPKSKIDLENFYDLLIKNKENFIQALTDYSTTGVKKGGKDTYKELIKYCKFLQKNSQKFTDKEEEFINILIRKLSDGVIPKKIVDSALKEIKNLKTTKLEPIDILRKLKSNIPEVFLQESPFHKINASEKKEIILSLYLNGE
ncbi:MAG: helicase-related protein [Ignavibacterium sp.]|nr:helicase-related protein [Ignavibacterium sp.]